MAIKKISSHTVDTDIVVLVIHVVQQLGVNEMWGWQKSLAIVDMKSNCLAILFIHSQGAMKHPLSPWSWKTEGKLSSCS